MTHLPGAVHLVAQAPGFDIVGLLHPVGYAQVAVLGARGVIAVFQKAAGCVDAPGAQIHRHHQLRAGLLCPAGKLVHTHLVGLGAAPCQLQAAGALLSEMRQAIPRPESQAMSTHGRRGMEEARQLLG